MTEIQDKRLQELFDHSRHTIWVADGEAADEAFILALNDRLRLADELAKACAVEHGDVEKELECPVCEALARYRSTQPEQQHKETQRG